MKRMKGVIVQTGDPKSIVLLNNGKLKSIPTPENCHVGMVVTVEYSDLPKTIIIICAVLLLFIIGILIGAHFFGGSTEPDPYEYRRGGRHGHGHMMMQQR
jgi:hypothetical protein